MKEHIKNLELILLHPAYLDTNDAAAIRAAIELMNAAKPKDEAAERERCSLACNEMLQLGLVIEDWLESERAQARAESVIPLMQRVTAECLRNAELTDQLSAAQAELAEKARVLTIAFDDRDCAIREMEIARARPVIQTVEYDHRAMNALAALRGDYAALETKLSAAQAEVAQLRTELQTTKPTWYVQNKLAETEAQLSAAQVEIAKLTSDLQRRYEDVKLLRNQLQIQAAQHAHWNDAAQAENSGLLAQLTAAQAEIERLQANEQQSHADWTCLRDENTALRTKLSAAQAEIERLKAERVAHALRADILEIKLTSLRTAAEDFIDSDCDTKDISVFAAAIEASR